MGRLFYGYPNAKKLRIKNKIDYLEYDHLS